MSWFSPGDHLQQSGPPMAAIVDPGGPSTATQYAVDGPGDQLWRGTTCGVTVPPLVLSQLSSDQKERLISARLIDSRSSVR